MQNIPLPFFFNMQTIFGKIIIIFLNYRYKLTNLLSFNAFCFKNGCFQAYFINFIEILYAFKYLLFF